MHSSLLIFVVAFFVRILNLYLHQIDSSTYLIEDQLIYWEWSLNNAYTSNNLLKDSLLVERMPGSFLFFQFIIWLVGENLFNVLVIQSLIDAINCIVIAYIAKNINVKLFILAGMLSAFSPLMIIVSSQILSDTIFLFFFSSSMLCILTFTKYKQEKFIYLGAIFLGFSLCTRIVVLPLIFLLGIFIGYICLKEKYNFLKIARIISIFFIFSLSLILPRAISNYYNFNSISLTTQSGSHFAYWVLPAVLDFDVEEKKNLYMKKLQGLNMQLEILENPFEKSALLKKEAFKYLLNTEKKFIIMAWVKGAVLNISAPSFIIDKRVRSLPHPSFYDNDRNVAKWLTDIFRKDEYKKYKVFLILSSIFSILFLSLFSYGSFLLLKNHLQSSIMLFIISVYFIAVTGPVFSPKYIHPILPFLIITEAIALVRVIELFFKLFKHTKYN